MAIKALEQEPRKGHWIPYLKEGLIVKCSECKSRYTLGYNFCPNCGAKKPAADNGWICTDCGTRDIKTNFCPNCGNKKPAEDMGWDCPACGQAQIKTKARSVERNCLFFMGISS